jgi:hypothetical protein
VACFCCSGKKLEAVSQNVSHNIQAVSHNLKDKAQEINAQRKPRTLSTQEEGDHIDGSPVATPGTTKVCTWAAGSSWTMLSQECKLLRFG